jgi:hypothetical protein
MQTHGCRPREWAAFLPVSNRRRLRTNGPADGIRAGIIRHEQLTPRARLQFVDCNQSQDRRRPVRLPLARKWM